MLLHFRGYGQLCQRSFFRLPSRRHPQPRRAIGLVQLRVSIPARRPSGANSSAKGDAAGIARRAVERQRRRPDRIARRFLSLSFSRRRLVFLASLFGGQTARNLGATRSASIAAMRSRLPLHSAARDKPFADARLSGGKPPVRTGRPTGAGRRQPSGPLTRRPGMRLTVSFRPARVPQPVSCLFQSSSCGRSRSWWPPRACAIRRMRSP